MKHRKATILPIKKIQTGVKYIAKAGIMAGAGALTAILLFGCDKKINDVNDKSGLIEKLNGPNAVVRFEDKREQVNEDNSVIEDKEETYSNINNLSKDTPYKISENGINLIKSFEGFSATPYEDYGQMSIGYGHMINSGERNLTEVNETKAINYLKEDLDYFEDVISKSVNVPLNQGQYDALCSFVYNFGETKFNNSTLLKKLNNEDYSGAAEEFKRWVNIYDNEGNKKALPGLVKRRKAESEMFKGN